MYYRLTTILVLWLAATGAFSQQIFESIPFLTSKTQYFTDLNWGDYDQDGDLDLLTVGQITGGNTEYDISLFRNDGAGNFAVVPIQFPTEQAVYVEWADFDNDTDLDIIMVGTFDGIEAATRILRNDGYDQFTLADHNLPPGRMARMADFNGDGLVDLALYEYWIPMRIYRNKGNFQFESVMEFTLDGEEIVWNDFNSDGKVDFSRGKYLYKNIGNDQFSQIDMGFTNNGIARYAWGDFDKDGDDDFMRFEAIWTYFPNGSATSDEHIDMFENTGNAVFTNKGRMNEVSSFNETATFDFDGDGDLDILLTQGEFAPVQSATQIIKNNGNWTFQKQFLNPSLRSKYSFAVADYDNDQDADVIVSGEHLSKAVLVRNSLTPQPQRPSVPANTQTNLVSNVLTLSWNASIDNEAGSPQYNVYVKRDSVYYFTPYTDITMPKSGLPGFANVGRNRSVQINISDWSDGYYTWGVQSVDGEFNVSVFSGEKQFTKYTSNGPSAPTNLRSVSVASNAVQLQWNDNASDETSYTIERSATNGNKDFQLVTTLPANTTTYINNGVLSNQHYYYRVRLNRTGVVALSNVLGIKTPPGLSVAPSGLSVNPVASSRLKVDWQYAGTGHTGFIIQRSMNDKSDFVSIDSIDAATLTFTDQGLESQKKYFYRVMAYGNAGNSDYSNIAYSIPPPHGFSVTTIASLSYEFGGYNMAWGDYDNDGFEDLFVGYKCQLYRNIGNGTFELVQHNIKAGDNLMESIGAWGDFDNDGTLDIVVSTNTDIRLYRNKGNGVFEEVQCSLNFDRSTVLGVSWNDLDNDGDLDIVTGRYYYRYDGDNIFTRVALPGQPYNYGFTYTTASGDFNEDGNIDLFTSNYGSNQFLLNDGTGNFSEVIGSPAVEDTNYPCCPIRSPFAIWVDYNNDRHLDLTAFHEGTDYLYKGNGSTLINSGINFDFTYDANTITFWEDYDNDGDQDLIILGSYDRVTKIYENTGNGVLTPNINTGLSVNVDDYHTVSWFDYDNDGFRDAIAFGSTHKIFKNAGNTNKWIKVRLAGKASNSKGIGATIFLKSGGTWQRRDIITNHSYLVQHGYESIFGLRNSATVDSIKVLWPSGAIQTLAHISSNQIITLHEQDAQFKPFFKPSNLRGKIIPASTLELIWKDNSADEDGFVIQHSTDGINFSDLATVGAGVQTYTVADLIQGSTHYYKVMGVKGGVRSAPTNVYKEKMRHFQRLDVNHLTTYQFESSGVAWSDFNGDGYQDLFVNGRSFEGDALYRNTADGHFVKQLPLPSSIFNNSRSGTWGDFDNDGKQDLYVAVGGNFSTVDEGMVDKMYKNNGNNNFTQVYNTVTSNTIGAHSGAWGDVNGDGFLDLMIATDRRTLKFTNLGGSSFSTATPLTEYGESRLLTLTDYDNDRDLDLIQSSGYSLQILKNDRGELKQTVNLNSDHVNGLVVEDFDHDGDFDILTVGSQGAYFYFLDAYTKTYSRQQFDGSTDAYTACVAGDYDNNGFQDIILFRTSHDNEFYLNDGTTYLPQTGEDFDAIRYGISLCHADYDRNGTLDLVLSSGNDVGRYLFSGLPTRNHWMRVKLIGHQSNRDGIGAKIKLINPGRIQIREIRSSSGSYSSNEQIAHFGLGSENEVKYLKIEWPSGISQWIANPVIDSLLVIDEGEGVQPDIEIEAPSVLQASLLPELKVKLEWQDNSAIETGFVVMRSVNNGAFVSYKALPANTTTYIDNIAGVNAAKVVVQYKVVATFDELTSESSNTAEIAIVITGVESPADLSLRLYPNPADRVLLIESESPIQHIALYSAQGRSLKEVNAGGVLSHRIDVTEFTDGVYLLKIKTSVGNHFRKVAIRKR